MQKIRINKEWRFTFENMLDEFSTMGLDKYAGAAGAPARFYEHSNWEKIDLPHDFALSLKRSRKAIPMPAHIPILTITNTTRKTVPMRRTLPISSGTEKSSRPILHGKESGFLSSLKAFTAMRSFLSTVCISTVIPAVIRPFRWS